MYYNLKIEMFSFPFLVSLILKIFHRQDTYSNFLPSSIVRSILIKTRKMQIGKIKVILHSFQQIKEYTNAMKEAFSK